MYGRCKTYGKRNIITKLIRKITLPKFGYLLIKGYIPFGDVDSSLEEQ